MLDRMRETPSLRAQDMSRGPHAKDASGRLTSAHATGTNHPSADASDRAVTPSLKFRSDQAQTDVERGARSQLSIAAVPLAALEVSVESLQTTARNGSGQMVPG